MLVSEIEGVTEREMLPEGVIVAAMLCEGDIVAATDADALREGETEALAVREADTEGETDGEAEREGDTDDDPLRDDVTLTLAPGVWLAVPLGLRETLALPVREGETGETDGDRDSDAETLALRLRLTVADALRDALWVTLEEAEAVGVTLGVGSGGAYSTSLLSLPTTAGV